MLPHIVRVLLALAAAFLVAGLIRLMAFPAAEATDASAKIVPRILQSAWEVTKLGWPFALAGVVFTEVLRIRNVLAHFIVGGLAALASAYLWSRGLPVDAFGLLGRSPLPAVLAIGGAGALTYWLLWGHQSGWRGDDIEQQERDAAAAFLSASSGSQRERCWPCIIGGLLAGLLPFLLYGWMNINKGPLQQKLVADAEGYAGKVLTDAGYPWAKMKVEGYRGIVTGEAPDDAQRTAAFDKARDAMKPIIGVPGVVGLLENAITVKASSDPKDDIAQKILEEESRRLQEAKAAAEAQRRAEEETHRQAEEQARLAAEAEAAEKRKAEEDQRLAAEAEAKRKAEEEAKLEGEAETKRKAAEEARLAAEAEAKRKADEDARLAAEAEAKRKAEEDARLAAEAEAKTKAAAEQEKIDSEKKAWEQAARAKTEVAAQPAPAPVAAAPVREACSGSDITIIQNSRILFANESSAISANDKEALDRVAEAVKSCSDRPVLISGHSDTLGIGEFNAALGLERAEAVRQALVLRDVAPSLLLTESAGISRPIASNATLEGRALNRRVEFKLLDPVAVLKDPTQTPAERAATCENDLAAILSSAKIEFRSGSSQISAESQDLIRKLTEAIKVCGNVSVTVEGHTDKTGRTVLNQALSERRAAAVKNALIAAGADGAQLSSRGFGATRPIDPGDSDEALARNRRIDFKANSVLAMPAAKVP